MKNENTTVCKMCDMEISPKAKKCPYCQHFQNKWLMIAYHPLFFIISMVVIVALMGMNLETLFSEGESFADYRNAVSVVEPKMVFGVTGCEHKSPTVAILGRIQNDSPVSWKDVRLEATFFDKEGRLIDATQKEQYSFMVAAKDNGTFKLSFQREFPETQYDSFKVRIISAKDERKRF
jgi:succinate dehydrogenase flavin-adding protein (antitoxin of CptAB toxin-antitoxin module)